MPVRFWGPNSKFRLNSSVANPILLNSATKVLTIGRTGAEHLNGGRTRHFSWALFIIGITGTGTTGTGTTGTLVWRGLGSLHPTSSIAERAPNEFSKLGYPSSLRFTTPCMRITVILSIRFVSSIRQSEEAHMQVRWFTSCRLQLSESHAWGSIVIDPLIHLEQSALTSPGS